MCALYSTCFGFVVYYVILHIIGLFRTETIDRYFGHDTVEEIIDSLVRLFKSFFVCQSYEQLKPACVALLEF